MRLRPLGRLATSFLLAAGLLAGCSRAPEPRRAADPPEAYRSSVAALMWPGATRSYQVTPDGDLFNGEWWVEIDGTAGADTAGPPPLIANENRWCPVVRWTRRAGPVRFEFEAVASPEPEPAFFAPRGALARHLAARQREHDRRDLAAILATYPAGRIDSLLLHVKNPLARDPLDHRNLFVSLEVTAINEGAAATRADLRVRLATPIGPVPYRAPDRAPGLPWNSSWTTGHEDGDALAFGEGVARERTLDLAFDLAPGGSRARRVILSAYAVPARTLQGRAREPHAETVLRTRAFWTREVARGATFDVPDPLVAEALRSARVQLLSLRERRLEDWVPIGGPFHYRGVWLRDGARAMQALALAGYVPEARSMASAFLQFQWPHGPIMSQGGQLDGTGQALWVFDQVLSRPAPAATPELRRYARAAIRACAALDRQRALTADAGPGVFPGLLPVTEPHDNELVAAQLVGNDAWSIAGFRAAARLARTAGLAAEADTLERTLAAYQATFERAMHAAGPDDLAASWQGIGIDWGNLAVGYPCMTLPASDPHLAGLARRYWAPVGGAGLGYYRNPDSLHSYVGGDLGTWALLAGRRASADSVLDAAIAWRSASGGAAECFEGSTRDFGVNFPPHPTAAAVIITLVRNALVFDDAGALQLTLGARDAWWRGSKVRRAPTRWGLLDLTFRREGNRARWRWTPVPVWTALTLPPHTRLAGPLPGALRPGPRPDVVLAPPRTQSVALDLVATPGAAL